MVPSFSPSVRGWNFLKPSFIHTLGYLASGHCAMSHSEKNKSGELHLFPSLGERMERHLIRWVQLLDKWRSFSNLPLFHVKWDRSYPKIISEYMTVDKYRALVNLSVMYKHQTSFNSNTLCVWKNRGLQPGLISWMLDLMKSNQWLQICIQYSESVYSVNSFYIILGINVLILWRRIWSSKKEHFILRAAILLPVQDQPQIYRFLFVFIFVTIKKYAHSVWSLMFELSSLFKRVLSGRA